MTEELLPTDEAAEPPTTAAGAKEARDFVQPELGRSLRGLRQERGMTLRDVAAATGLSSSFLALVEHGRSDIAIGRLMRLLTCYGAKLTDLFGDADRRPSIVVSRADARHLRSQEGVDLYLLAADTNRAMMPVLTTFEPGARLNDLKPHDGETFVHVIEGDILFELAGYDPIVLHEGDTAYFKPFPHPPAYVNVGERRAVLVAAVAPPSL